MRKKHQAIYDDGYTAAIRDITKEIFNGEELDKYRIAEVIRSLVKPIEERYNISYDR